MLRLQVHLYASMTVCFLVLSLFSNLTNASLSKELVPQEFKEQELNNYNNFLLGIAELGATQQPYNNTQCGLDLITLLAANARKEPWSVKVVDSFGTTPRSFMWGNYFWFSSHELCEDVNEPFSITMNDESSRTYFNKTSPYPVQFTMIYLRFRSPYYINWKLPYENLIHLGLCLPKTCNQQILSHLTAAYFESNIFETQQKFSLQLEVVDAKVPILEWNFFKQTGSILFISILVLRLILIPIAEFSKTSQQTLLQLKEQKSQQNNESPLPTKETGFLNEVLQCFDIRNNLKCASQLETSNPERSFLSVIAGLRTVICLWVTVFHVYYYSLFATANLSIVLSKLEYVIFQPILQACFYVDVFFVMSAFLLVYNFLKNEKQIQQIKSNSWKSNLKYFTKSLFYRYMRLTPVLIVTMLLADMISTYINMATPFHLDTHSGIYCKRNWWQNLLYVQNLLDMNNICCSWTWYLGCEMQFFVLFTILLMIYAKNAKMAKIIFTILAIGFSVISWFCNYYWGITFHIDKVNGTLNELYVKPWVRINPYIGGAAIAYLLHRYQQQTLQRIKNVSFKMSKAEKCSSNSWKTNIFWFMCAIVYLTTNFMSHWRSAPTWIVSSIMSFGKLFFALCVGGMISLCALGRGDLFNRLLSARPFLLLNKFCYSIYMVAPLIVFVVFGLRREATLLSEIGSGMDFIAIVTISIASAFLMFVLVELPANRVTKLLLRENRVNQAKPQQQQQRQERPFIMKFNINNPSTA